MLYWPIPHCVYLAPFPEECRGTLNVRLGCTGQDPTLFTMEKGGIYGMANVCALPSAF